MHPQCSRPYAMRERIKEGFGLVRNQILIYFIHEEFCVHLGYVTIEQQQRVRERKLWNLIKIGTGTREVPQAQQCIFSNWISSCNHVGFLLLKFISWLASAMHSRDRSINLWVFASALFCVCKFDLMAFNLWLFEA